MTRDVKHGEEIDHAYIVAPFARGWLDIPESVDILSAKIVQNLEMTK